MDLSFLAAVGYVTLGLVAGVLLEERLLYWLLHRPRPERKRRQVRPYVPAVHAGRYARPRSVAGSADVPGQFRQVR